MSSDDHGMILGVGADTESGSVWAFYSLPFVHNQIQKLFYTPKDNVFQHEKKL